LVLSFAKEKHANGNFAEDSSDHQDDITCLVGCLYVKTIICLDFIVRCLEKVNQKSSPKSWWVKDGHEYQQHNPLHITLNKSKNLVPKKKALEVLKKS